MHAVLLIDGTCIFCNYWLQKVYKWDKHSRIKFGSIQEYSTYEISKTYPIDKSIDSVVLLYKNKLYYKSTAILYVLKTIGGWRSSTIIFFIIPRFIRDFFYDLVAKNRYKWFGQKDDCLLPSAVDKSRFI